MKGSVIPQKRMTNDKFPNPNGGPDDPHTQFWSLVICPALRGIGHSRDSSRRIAGYGCSSTTRPPLRTIVRRPISRTISRSWVATITVVPRA